jgi:multidrug transporter EmrE-like cation transporter
MTSQGLLLVILSALGTVAGNLLIRAGLARAGGLGFSVAKLSQVFLQPLMLAGLVLYATAALLWFRVVSTEELTTSYPLLVSMTFILVTLGAVFFFDERISVQKALGMGVILIGIVVIARA